MTRSRHHNREETQPRPVPPRRGAKEQESNKSKFLLLLSIPLIAGASMLFSYYYHETLKHRVITPVALPKLNRLNDGANATLYWGTYRPHTYFGLKARHPVSPLFGLMWYQSVGSQTILTPLRHWCEHGAGVPWFGWQAHDGALFGQQEIKEGIAQIQTDFVKRPSAPWGGDWTVRVRATPQPGVGGELSLLFYIAGDIDDSGFRLSPATKGSELTHMTGTSAALGRFQVHFTSTSPTGAFLKKHHLIASKTSFPHLHDLAMKNVRQFQDSATDSQYIGLSGKILEAGASPGFVVYQVVSRGPVEFEIVFESESALRRDRLAGSVFEAELQQHLSNFNERFEQVFHLKGRERDVGKATLSNLLGGMGYFSGRPKVQSPYHAQPVDSWPAELFSATPSRPFFPRGFLWDEGFHLLVISRWDVSLAKESVAHWLDLMNAEGWIPREVILGDEARAKVPENFVVQRSTHANPPSMMLAIRALLQLHGTEDKAFLAPLASRLDTWFRWFNTTQTGPLPLSYRWRGREDTPTELNPKTLTSGLDDFPRATQPTDNERHVDLRSWMALTTSIMAELVEPLSDDATWRRRGQEYASHAALLADNRILDQMHWSESAGHYCDFGLHSTKVRLNRVTPNPNQPPRTERVTMSPPEQRFVEDTFGYVSLFPLMLRLIDPLSPKLTILLEKLRNPDLLWTPHGLRSLSRRSPFYEKRNTEHDPPYWRGAIWINMNYLVIGALNHYGKHVPLAAEIYVELRNNVISNMLKQYEETGFLWEQYNDKTGRGQGTHPFTGWSSLLVLIMAEKY